jgi:hypothetical protein
MFDTADFNPANPGNLRADYVLPSADLDILGGGIFWPLQADPLSALTGNFPFPSSDHRLVYVDVNVVPEPATAALFALAAAMVAGSRKRAAKEAKQPASRTK